ncbi:MAG: winged helix-turn-helix transcriptional regulator [Bacteroidetes bacterium]|nr:winged helix-turn-helix transcriptional regulator [Bacteroidota bacterium]
MEVLGLGLRGHAPEPGGRAAAHGIICRAFQRRELRAAADSRNRGHPPARTAARGAGQARDRLLDLVWGENVVVTDRAIDTHVANIRKKLGPHGSRLISSVRGMGYRFEG